MSEDKYKRWNPAHEPHCSWVKWISSIAFLFLENKTHISTQTRRCRSVEIMQIMFCTYWREFKDRDRDRDTQGAYSELIWVNAFINTSKSNGSLVPISTLFKKFLLHAWVRTIINGKERFFLPKQENFGSTLVPDSSQVLLNLKISNIVKRTWGNICSLDRVISWPFIHRRLW